MKNKYILFKSAQLLIIIAASVGLIFSVFMAINSYTSQPVQTQANHRVKTIVCDGRSYFPKQDMTTVLIMGIDDDGPVKDSGSYNNGGLADVLWLVVFDESSEKFDVICFNRDSMIEMTMLGIGGKPAGTRVAQLALAHTYGSGLEDSCENTVNAVEKLINNIPIDYYISVNMDAISIITDSVGGVSVNVTDDFSDIDPTITQGSIKLNGSQAYNFIRTRRGIGDQKNLSRMERHREFAYGFLQAFSEVDHSNFVFNTYEELAPYMVTDCSVENANMLMNKYGDYTLGQMIIPEGKNVQKDYMEFYIDREKLDRTVVELMYVEKQ